LRAGGVFIGKPCLILLRSACTLSLFGTDARAAAGVRRLSSMPRAARDTPAPIAPPARGLVLM